MNHQIYIKKKKSNNRFEKLQQTCNHHNELKLYKNKNNQKRENLPKNIKFLYEFHSHLKSIVSTR